MIFLYDRKGRPRQLTKAESKAAIPSMLAWVPVLAGIFVVAALSPAQPQGKPEKIPAPVVQPPVKAPIPTHP